MSVNLITIHSKKYPEDYQLFFRGAEFKILIIQILMIKLVNV